jgi:hypothetical protein
LATRQDLSLRTPGPLAPGVIGPGAGQLLEKLCEIESQFELALMNEDDRKTKRSRQRP